MKLKQKDTMNKVEKKEVVDFLKALEESGIISPNAHKRAAVIDSVQGIMEMTEEEHEAFQKDTPSQSVKMFFFEYRDWKKSYV
jgi:hypothetical protein